MNTENNDVLEQFQAEELESRLEMWGGGNTTTTSSTTGWEVTTDEDGNIIDTNP